MINQPYKKLGLLFAGLFVSAAFAAETRLAYSKKDQIELFVLAEKKDEWCEKAVKLKMVGRDEAYYRSTAFETLFNKVSKVIVGECSGVNRVELAFFSEDKKAINLKAEAEEGNAWQVVFEQPTLPVAETAGMNEPSSEKKTKTISLNKTATTDKDKTSVANAVKDVAVPNSLENTEAVVGRKENEKAVKKVWNFNGWSPTIVDFGEALADKNFYSLKTKDKRCAFYLPTIRKPEEIDFLYIEPNKGVTCADDGYLYGKGSATIKYVDGRDRRTIEGFFAKGSAFSKKNNSQLAFLPIFGKRDKYGYATAMLAEDANLGIAFANLYWDDGRYRWYLGDRVDVMVEKEEMLLNAEQLNKLYQFGGASYANVHPKTSKLRMRLWSGYSMTNDDGETLVFHKEPDENRDYLFYALIRKSKQGDWQGSDSRNYYMKRVIADKQAAAEEQRQEDEKQAEAQRIAQLKEQASADAEAEAQRIAALKGGAEGNTVNTRTKDLSLSPDDEIKQQPVNFTIAGRAAKSQFVGDLVVASNKAANGLMLYTKDKQCALYFPSHRFGDGVDFLYLEPKAPVVCENGYLTGEGKVIVRFVDGREKNTLNGYFAYNTIFENKKASRLDFIGFDQWSRDMILFYRLGGTPADVFAFSSLSWNSYYLRWSLATDVYVIYKGDNDFFMDKRKPLALSRSIADSFVKNYDANRLQITYWEDYERKNTKGERVILQGARGMDGFALYQQSLAHRKNGWKDTGSTNSYLKRQIAKKKVEEERKRYQAAYNEQLDKDMTQYKNYYQQHLEKLKTWLKSEDALIYAMTYRNLNPLPFRKPESSHYGRYRSRIEDSLFNIDYFTLYSSGGNHSRAFSLSRRYESIKELVQLVVDDDITVKWPYPMVIDDAIAGIENSGWYILTGEVGFDQEDKLPSGILKPHLALTDAYVCEQEQCGELLDAERLVKERFIDIEQLDKFKQSDETTSAGAN